MTKQEHAEKARETVEGINKQVRESGKHSTFLLRLAQTHARLAGGKIMEVNAKGKGARS